MQVTHFSGRIRQLLTAGIVAMALGTGATSIMTQPAAAQPPAFLSEHGQGSLKPQADPSAAYANASGYQRHGIGFLPEV